MTLQLMVSGGVALLTPLAFSVVATQLLDATGYRSWMPAVAMFSPVLMLYRLRAPCPVLVILAIAAWLVVLVARGPRFRMFRLVAIFACGASTIALQLLSTLTEIANWSLRAG